MAGGPSGWQSLPRYSFGDSPELADELLALVLAGKKRATCWSAAEGTKDTAVGTCSVVEDGQGRPRAVLRTVELTLQRFDQVHAEFAAAEGEGNHSLASWRDAHQAYFARNGGFTPAMTLWCERFELVETLAVEEIASATGQAPSILD